MKMWVSPCSMVVMQRGFLHLSLIHISSEKLHEITREIPTPYHLYDERGIRTTARWLLRAFAWNAGYREYYAVKACPNPFILKILKEEGCGVD